LAPPHEGWGGGSGRPIALYVSVCICMYLYVLNFTYIHIHTYNTYNTHTYMQIHAIHAHTDICILGFRYALYVCVCSFCSNTCNITGHFQYMHVCTGRITDGHIRPPGPCIHIHTCKKAVQNQACRFWML
jgi:hypothetical protein